MDSTAAVHRAWTQWGREVGVDVAGVLAVAHGRRTADTIRLVAPQRDAAAEAARIEEREIGQAQALRRYPGATALLGALPPGSWGGGDVRFTPAGVVTPTGDRAAGARDAGDRRRRDRRQTRS
ncbi:MAG: hypothetical protein M3493_06540 [Actinomycetota bacterium]|nr:hypothetical protein [Actinomycetota bacterium]